MERRETGRILEPLPESEVVTLYTNRFGVIPKGRTPGKWRLITDLSFPKGGSINNAISSNLYSLTYTLVDRVARAAHRLGPAALLVKVDIKAAYRLVPVHADNRSLLVTQWKGRAVERRVFCRHYAPVWIAIRPVDIHCSS